MIQKVKRNLALVKEKEKGSLDYMWPCQDLVILNSLVTYVTNIVVALGEVSYKSYQVAKCSKQNS